MVLHIFNDDTGFAGATRPLDISHMRLLRLALKFLQAWPEIVMGEKTKYPLLGKYYIFLIEFISLPPGLLYLRHHMGVIPFIELGHTYITVFMNIVAVSRLTLIFQKRYDKIVSDFVNKIHLLHYHQQSEYVIKIHTIVHKVSHYFTLYIIMSTIFGVILFNSTPLYKNITSGTFSLRGSGNVTFEQAVYYQLPFDYEHDIKGYIALFLFNFYISFVCSFCFSTFDLLMFLMVFHIWGHLRIFINTLNNFRRPETKDTANDHFSAEEMTQVSRDLRKIVQHHKIIIEFVANMKEIFGPILFVYYIFHFVSGCVLLLECSQMNMEALARYGILSFLVFQQMIQISIVFELLGTTSDQLINAVYNIPWECMDISNRRTVFIILLQSQKPLSIKALDMVDVGVQTMASILKTSMSYFIMLRTVADTE